jgi:hypothetical protein
MSRQISAIVCNASSSLDFFDSRGFSFGSRLRGKVRLAGTAFDAAEDFVAVAGRDVRFDAIVRGRLAEGVQGFWSEFNIIPRAATLLVHPKVPASELSGTAGERHGGG